MQQNTTYFFERRGVGDVSSTSISESCTGGSSLEIKVRGKILVDEAR